MRARFPRMRRPSASLLVAMLALFVALGGPAEAERLISGGEIRKNSITTKQVKDGTLKAADLSRTTRRWVQAVPDGSITDAKLGANSVGTRALAPGSVASGTVADASLTGDDLAANSVAADEVADNAVGQAEIRSNGVGAAEIADNSIDGGEIIDGVLVARDIAKFSGTLEVRFPAVPTRTCQRAPVSNAAPGADISKDLILVSASDAWPDSLTYHVKNAAPPETDKFVFVACNPTGADVTPPAVVLFRYAIVGF